MASAASTVDEVRLFQVPPNSRKAVQAFWVQPLRARASWVQAAWVQRSRVQAPSWVQAP